MNGTSVSRTLLLLNCVMVEGTRNGAFIDAAIARTELLSIDVDSAPVTLSVPPSALPVVESPMAKRFQVEVASNLLSWVSSSINLVFTEITKLGV